MTKKLQTIDGPATIAGNPPKGSEQHFTRGSLAESEWARLPKIRERCQVSGLSRSGLIDLAASVPGMLVKLKQRNAIRGACLLHLPTLRQYLRDVRESQINPTA